MIDLKTPPEIKIMSQGGKIANFTMKEIARNIKPGTTTSELNKIAHRIIIARGAKPSFLNHNGYPSSICISINRDVVHSIPSEAKIKLGDVIKVDLGVFYKGFHTDMARTFVVGNTSKKEVEMARVCRQSLNEAISQIKPGAFIGDIEYVIGKTLKGGGLSPIMSLTGHGIGRELHESPSIFCDGKKGVKEKLLPGMVLAIEPMATSGNGEVKKMKDNWTIRSSDNSQSFHFEDTIAITDRGCKVLTRNEKTVNIIV